MSIDPAVRTALVVEDDNVIRKAFAELLEDEGFEVMTASTLERARYILFESTHPVGVLVLDLVLPDGDGAGLLDELDHMGIRAPACVVLSAAVARAKPLALSHGIPLLTKPFDVEVAVPTVVVAFENMIRPRSVPSPPTQR
jgi:two-component system OmpR family response regulator